MTDQPVCDHGGFSIARRLGDYPAYYQCRTCGQHFRLPEGATPPGKWVRDYPVAPPSIEKDGPPCPAI